MFVNPIHNLDKTRFGINLKIEDFKCKLNNKPKLNKEDKNKKVK